MTSWTSGRWILTTLFLLLLVGGIFAGVWNHQEIEVCHETYDDDSTVVVMCEDSFTDIVYFLSVFSTLIGTVGMISVLYRRGE